MSRQNRENAENIANFCGENKRMTYGIFPSLFLLSLYLSLYIYIYNYLSLTLSLYPLYISLISLLISSLY